MSQTLLVEIRQAVNEAQPKGILKSTICYSFVCRCHLFRVIFNIFDLSRNSLIKCAESVYFVYNFS